MERIATLAISAGAASIKSGGLRYLIKGTCVVSVIPADRLWDGRVYRNGAVR